METKKVIKIIALIFAIVVVIVAVCAVVLCKEQFKAGRCGN